MELSFWAATDVGRKREANEDNFLVDKKLSLSWPQTPNPKPQTPNPKPLIRIS